MPSRDMHRCVVLLLTIACWDGVCSTSDAAIEFCFDTDQDTYTVLPGQTVHVDVFLLERVSGGDVSRLAAEDGLSQAQVAIERIAGPTDAASITGFLPNLSEFDDPFSPIENALSEDLLDVTQLVDMGAVSGPTGVDLGGGVRSVYLLTVTIQGATATGQSTFDVYDNSLFDETLTFDFLTAPLDSSLQPGQFTVSTVPEPPMGMIVLTASGLAILFSRRARRERS